MENTDFKSKVESIKSLIGSNYDTLIQYQKLSLESKAFQDTLLSQKKLTLKLFDQLFIIEKSECKTIKENEFTLGWWNSLSEEWKKLIIFNVQLMPYYHLSENSMDEQNNWENELKKFTSTPYDKIKNSNVDQSFLNKLLNLNSFIIVDIEENLSPISKFKDLTYLEIRSGNSFNLMRNSDERSDVIYNQKIYNFYPLVKLKKLHTLKIADNEGSNLHPISKIKTLEYLIVSEILPKELINLKYLNRISLIGSEGDIEIMSKIPTLEEINMGSTRNLNSDSFKKLRKLKKLKTMSFSDITPNNDLLNNLLSLKSLSKISIYSHGNAFGSEEESVLIKEFVNKLELNGIKVELRDSLTQMTKRIKKGRHVLE